MDNEKRTFGHKDYSESVCPSRDGAEKTVHGESPKVGRVGPHRE